jgi:hypothetical protein
MKFCAFRNDMVQIALSMLATPRWHFSTFAEFLTIKRLALFLPLHEKKARRKAMKAQSQKRRHLIKAGLALPLLGHSICRNAGANTEAPANPTPVPDDIPPVSG